MNKKTKGIIAGAAGIALLAGGATFATWSDSAMLGGGSITSGDFAIDTIGDVEWWDVSADRRDAQGKAPVTENAGHEITDLAQWKIVPGDVAEAAYAFDVKLAGDNLVAELDLSGLDAVAANGGTVTYKVYQPTGTTYADKTPAPGVETLMFAAPDTESALATGKIVVDNAANAADVVVVVSVSFDAINDLNTKKQVVDLNTIGVSLTQERAVPPAQF